MASVAQIPREHDIHPLLRHPKPITRDSAKAQRMLGLIADSEEKLSGLHREKSKTTKWLERPLYVNLDVSDVESEKNEQHESKRPEKDFEMGDYGNDADLLTRWTKLGRPTYFHSENAGQIPVQPRTKPDTLSNKKRPLPLQSLRPVSYHAQQLLSPEWTASPSTMSPNTHQQQSLPQQPNSPAGQWSSFSSASSSGSITQVLHPQTWPVPNPQWANHKAERPLSYQPPSSTSEQGSFSSLGSPQLNEKRPRPTSFATYQPRDRRNSKIASSRGLRSNGYPNFSHPTSDIAPKAIPGENMESHAVKSRFYGTTVSLPSPPSLIRPALNGFDTSNDMIKEEKKSKNRWSAIPQTFKKLTTRRLSTATQEKRPDMNTVDLRQMNLTENNMALCETEGSHHPVASKISTSGVNSLPTPTYSPVEFKSQLVEGALPPPFAPWADAPPSPASSQEKRRGSDMSLSPTRKRAPSRLSIESSFQGRRPDSMYSTHSRQSSYGMPSPVRAVPPPPMALAAPTSPWTGSRRGTPVLERTCILCKTTKEPSAFVNRRMSGNCWHEPATCFQCLRSHIEKCVTAQGWEHCTCPECNEIMTYEDIAGFADNDTFIKWED
ncbi:hypothetical protein GQ44DRAFT_696375 [Phaeosphaeriaceae sp. PMI808]|nr:hypothetical protein GQ44DRAFT_696375 [Phaeosphaeriaceae sp. PMI808]